LASALAQNGKRVLLIDLDPQAHASLGLDIESQNSMYNVISNLTPRKLDIDSVIHNVEENFDIAPSNILMGTLEQELSDEIGRELKLKEVIDPLAGRYDYILIDCAPSLGILTVNALRISDELVVPVETSRFSMQGVMHITDIVNLVRDRLNHDVKVRILVTMFDSRLRHSFVMLDKFREAFKEKIFSTIIHVNVKLKEAAVNGKSVSKFDKYCRGAKDYYSLAKEMISLESRVQEKTEEISSEAVEKAFKTYTFASKAETAKKDVVEQVELVQSKEAVIAKKVVLDASKALKEAPDVEEVNLAPVSEKMQEVLKAQAKDIYETVFSIEARGAKSVYVTGSFNDWSLDDTCRLKNSADKGRWETEISLKPGVYKYQFIVDGVWQEDPVNSKKERNSFGDINSLIEVGTA
ncbi:MAG: chromosome partitioning protein, partial [Candidatus Omnitrophota bacterium]